MSTSDKATWGEVSWQVHQLQNYCLTPQWIRAQKAFFLKDKHFGIFKILEVIQISGSQPRQQSRFPMGEQMN